MSRWREDPIGVQAEAEEWLSLGMAFRFNLGMLLGQAGSPEAAIHLAVLYRQDPDWAMLLDGQLQPR